MNFFLIIKFCTIICFYKQESLPANNKFVRLCFESQVAEICIMQHSKDNTIHDIVCDFDGKSAIDYAWWQSHCWLKDDCDEADTTLLYSLIMFKSDLVSKLHKAKLITATWFVKLSFKLSKIYCMYFQCSGNAENWRHQRCWQANLVRSLRAIPSTSWAKIRTIVSRERSSTDTVQRRCHQSVSFIFIFILVNE